MPTGVYVRKNAVGDRLKVGMAADHAADFAQWLRERHYTPRTIVEKMRLLASWTHWACVENYTLAAIREAHATSFALIAEGNARASVATSTRTRSRSPSCSSPISRIAACWRACRPSRLRRWWPSLRPGPASSAVWPKRRWPRISERSAPFIDTLGDTPAIYDAATIRAYMIERAKAVSVARMKGISVGIRAFLRFLIATGRCRPGLDHAMPNVAGWRLASIPRCLLPDADIARIIGTCEGERRLRDRAIILLLVRLGLRASEVARLSFGDIDWRRAASACSAKAGARNCCP